MGSRFLFSAAGLLLILCWLSYFCWLHNPIVKALTVIGWIVWAVGLVLIFVPMVVLRTKGAPQKGKTFVHTTAIVDSGVYAAVRHPLYLGWSLMYVAAMLFSQHWLVVAIGGLGVACMVLISRQEDRRLIEKFGAPYKAYMKSVPAMNLFAGTVRLLRRKRRRG
jgi:protein-S-isoprenylcysteine O-methyltransferase Ste14